MTTTELDLNRSAVARYLQLSTLFRRRVESGEWAVGAQIPTVDALAAECGVARMTIRQALDLLEHDGLIERFRAKGTFVKARPAQQLWCDVQTDWSGLLRARDGATIELLSVRRNATLERYGDGKLLLAPRYRHLRRRHWRDGKAFLIADVFIDERICSKIPQKAFTTKTAMKLISDMPGLAIADAHQTLTIGTADLETSAQLQIALNAPVAHVSRRAVDAKGCLILVADGIYRGDIVRLEVKLK